MRKTRSSTQSVPTQALFYLKQVRPHLHLYVSPFNLDPLAPAMPISTPESYAAELAEAGVAACLGAHLGNRSFREGRRVVP